MNTKTSNLVKSALLLALAVVMQLIGRFVPSLSQLFVGPVINAILIIAAFLCGTGWGVAVGVLTPVLALLVGQLNPLLGAFIPFIMIGNVLLVVFCGLFKKTSKEKYQLLFASLGIVIGAFAKFIFMYLSATKLIHVFGLKFAPKIVKQLPVAMGTLQLITALIGGVLALVILGILKSRKQTI